MTGQPVSITGYEIVLGRKAAQLEVALDMIETLQAKLAEVQTQLAAAEAKPPEA